MIDTIEECVNEHTANMLGNIANELEDVFCDSDRVQVIQEQREFLNAISGHAIL